jgi:CDP-diglyceride synthetase
LNQRVSSALIAIPLALLVIILGRAYLAATLLVFGIMAVREFYDLAQFSGYGPLEQVGILGVIAFVAFGSKPFRTKNWIAIRTAITIA